MNIYHWGDNSPGKWTIAGLVVITALMLSPVAANAVYLPYNLAAVNADIGTYDFSGQDDIGNIIGKGGNGGKWEPNQTDVTQLGNGGQSVPLTEPACPVPEPGTLVLLASGFGMMLWRRSRKLL